MRLDFPTQPCWLFVCFCYVVLFCFTNVSLGSLPKLRTVYCRDSKAKDKGLKVRIKISVENKLGPALSFSAANEMVFFSGCALP